MHMSILCNSHCVVVVVVVVVVCGGVIYMVRCIENITLPKNHYGYCRLKVNER